MINAITEEVWCHSNMCHRVKYSKVTKPKTEHALVLKPIDANRVGMLNLLLGIKEKN